MIRIFHDDVRPCPTGWVLARTNIEAQALLATKEVEVISLDHDLGGDPADGLYVAGQGEETGLDLVRWMIVHSHCPPIIEIHSWNPEGARRMRATLACEGILAEHRPYQVPDGYVAVPDPPSLQESLIEYLDHYHPKDSRGFRWATNRGSTESVAWLQRLAGEK